MAFDRLQALGEEKFHKIINLLMRGESATRVARMLQQQPPEGWGLFQNFAEASLVHQLNRLRLAAAEGLYGKAVAKRIAEGSTPQVKLLENVSIRVLDRMEELSLIQRDRIKMLVEREQASMQPAPSTGVSNLKIVAPINSKMVMATNAALDDYRKLLLDLQKIRFDLGLDEFKGPIGGMTIRGVSQTTTSPDGMSVQRQVFEAVSTVERILDTRKIPSKTP